METSYADSWSDMTQSCDIDLWVMKWRSAYPLDGPVILPYILKTVWSMDIVLWDYESIWLEVWPQNKEGHCDLYFMVQWFCLVSWRLTDVWTSLFGIMNQYDHTFDLKIDVGHCDLYFMVKWFCFISWRLFHVWTSLFGIMTQYDPKFNLKINLGHYDLYFMVQQLCVISWGLFDVWTSYFGIVGQYDLMFDLKIDVGLCNLYFMVQSFVLYLQDYLMHECHIFRKWDSVTQSLSSK